jgi:hypothetical protein
VAFEYPTSAGPVRLVGTARGWTIHFNNRTHGQWRSADEAAVAVARHETGLAEWDQKRLPTPEDLIDWRPLGESI